MTDNTEIEAMRTINEALGGLEDDESRRRVLVWAASKYGARDIVANRHYQQRPDEREFPDFASLFDAARPRTAEERALAAAYWFQTAQGQGELDSQSLNTALKNLGHGVANITDALSGLIKRQPALVLQVKKSGKSKQARKKYRLTAAGIREVQRMVAGEPLNQEEDAS